MSRRKKPSSNGEHLLQLGKDKVPEDPMGKELAPFLFDLLAPRFVEGVCVRLGARIGLRAVGGYYLVSVGCPSEQVQTTVTCASLANLVDQIETSLGGGGCVWLPDFEAQKKARQEARR